MNKPHMMNEKNRRMVIDFDWWNIVLAEEGDELWHYLWDITEDCIRAVMNYWIFKAEELWRNKLQLSHPCSERLIEVKKKKEPRYKRLFNSFKK